MPPSAPAPTATPSCWRPGQHQAPSGVQHCVGSANNPSPICARSSSSTSSTNASPGTQSRNP
eukprot:8774162-Lingulodinium_polyedra.AAC.1